MINFIENKRKVEENRRKVEENKKIQTYKKLNLKYYYNSVVPLNLYTCWHTKDLPPLMKQNYELMKNSNPKITFHLYNEDECREFIKTHFKEDVLDAYDRLIPCAYKADLWRYCVLFINGGIYMDIKYKCINNFKFISLTEKEHFVRDRPENYVYNALISSKPNNPILLNCIKQIVENVKNKYYGDNALQPTGPGLLGIYLKKEIHNMDLYFMPVKINNKELDTIWYNNINILECYTGYRYEQKLYQKKNRYNILWDNKNIYK
jgi:mannosyltransferase OCH1-like enzyme